MACREQARSGIEESSRRTVLRSLSAYIIEEKIKDKPHYVYEFAELIGNDQSTSSKHLGILKTAGIIQNRKGYVFSQKSLIRSRVLQFCFLNSDGVYLFHILKRLMK